MPVSNPIKYTQDDLDAVLAFVEQHYYLTGEFLSAEAAFKQEGIPSALYKTALSQDGVKDALEEKGVVFARLEEGWQSKSLTPIQLLTANTLLDLTDTRSQKKKLSDLQVNTQTYNAWLKDPVFKEYISKRAKQMIGDNEHEVDLALIDRIRAGDLKAIEYYNEMTGRFVKQRATTNQQVDIQNVLIKVIEIITEEVNDPQTAMNISNRLKSLITARNVAGALVGDMDADPITLPEVVKVRRELE